MVTTYRNWRASSFVEKPLALFSQVSGAFLVDNSPDFEYLRIDNDIQPWKY